MHSDFGYFEPTFRRQLDKHFSVDDLKVLCRDLGIDYEAFPPSSKQNTISEIIMYCERRGRLSDLLAYVKKERPRVKWPFIPDDKDTAGVPIQYKASGQTQILRPNQEVTVVQLGTTCRVTEFLGSGTRGELYRTTINGRHMGLKWYYPTLATEHRRLLLNQLIEQGPPDGVFLWPQALITANNVPGFGYLMPWREPRFSSIVDLMWRRIEPSFRVLTVTGRHLSSNLSNLHQAGLCYQDTSLETTVFFDPENGELRLGDCDHIVPAGRLIVNEAVDLRFMAPEISLGLAAPGINADRHMLAVLLFYIFMVHHPLDGAQDIRDEKERYIRRPLFIFDPLNDANRPVPNLHDNALAFWPIYPTFLQQLFTQAFTDGFRNPAGGRVSEQAWMLAMVRLRDAIVDCSTCTAENFYDPDRDILRCWSCRRVVKLPPRLHINDQVIILNPDTKLYPHHVDPVRRLDLSEPIAEVRTNSTQKDLLDLKNLSTQPWRFRTAANRTKKVKPGNSVTLEEGLKIHFGPAESLIHTQT